MCNENHKRIGDMSMNVIAINGSPLANRITGIERYMYEVIKRLDQIIDTKCVKVYLLCPLNVEMNIPNLENIQVEWLESKNKKITLVELKRFLHKKKARYCTMSGNLCIQKDGIVCIHDIRPWIYRQYDPMPFRVKCAINFLSSKFLSSKVITVSETSRKEIIQYLGIKESRVTVISNGWEHIRDIAEDTSFWDRHENIRKGSYYYSLGSQAPHKNFKWVIEVARRNPNKKFVIAGKKWEYSNTEIGELDNLIYLGYVTDEENKTLMKHCRAYIHPSKYEGFGIPPLEALACGSKIYVSNVSCLPEIFQNVAIFFDPDNYAFDFNDDFYPSKTDIVDVLNRYSWENAAYKWNGLFIGADYD